jgi:hypothetical protein
MLTHLGVENKTTIGATESASANEHELQVLCAFIFTECLVLFALVHRKLRAIGLEARLLYINELL